MLVLILIIFLVLSIFKTNLTIDSSSNFLKAIFSFNFYDYLIFFIINLVKSTISLK